MKKVAAFLAVGLALICSSNVFACIICLVPCGDLCCRCGDGLSEMNVSKILIQIRESNDNPTDFMSTQSRTQSHDMDECRSPLGSNISK
jgi:hypothetical protein